MALGKRSEFVYSDLLSRRTSQCGSGVIPLQAAHPLAAIRAGRNRRWRGVELRDDRHLHVEQPFASVSEALVMEHPMLETPGLTATQAREAKAGRTLLAPAPKYLVFTLLIA